MTSTLLFAASFIVLFYLSDGESISGKRSPPTMTRPLFRGTHGALRLGIVGNKPLNDFVNFPAWRRFFNSWMTREKGPFVPENSANVPFRGGIRYTIQDANGTWWTEDTRHQFNITLPDEMLERLGAALALNVSYSQVVVVLSGDALDGSHGIGVLDKDVDAYIIFVENSSDVAEARRLFSTHDQRLVAHHFHATKWDIRKGHENRRCEYDALKKAFDTLSRAEGSLAKVNWSEGELEALAVYDLWSLKPALYVVNVSREQYMLQDSALVAATEEWVHKNQLGERLSPVILTSIELEEELAQPNSSSVRSNVVSVFDDLLGDAFRYLHLTQFYVLHESNIQAWYIPAGTRADMAAGVVFHKPCDPYFEDGLCTTRYYHFNETAFRYLARVDVGRADVFAKHATGTLDEKDFTTRDVDYGIQDGDVVKFMILDEWNDTLAEPGPECVGFEDARPRLLHPIGSDLRIAIIGLSNAGKTTLFNLLTGSNAAVSPTVFTTRSVTSRRTTIPDERFEWLAKQFPQATQRPSTITFIDTPAILDPFDDVPWKNDVLEALRGSDVVYHVIRAFNDVSVEQWERPAYERPSRWQHVKSYGAVNSIMRTHDREVLAKMRENATNGDDLDALGTIEDNVRGYHRSGVRTDQRVRYHDWNERELAVLERIRLLTSKPIVYAINLDAEGFANATSSESFLHDARAYIEKNDMDALVLPFAGRVLREEAKASLFDAGELSGADAILHETIEDCEIGHFYTANEDLVAAWAIKLGTTVEEAIELTNATLESHVTVVEAVHMRGMIEAGSVEKALSLGIIRRLRFEDEVVDGDLLLLTPGKLDEAVKEITDSMAVSGSTLGSSTLDAPTGEEGSYGVSWGYVFSLAFNAFLLTGLLLALLSNKDLVKRIRTRIDEYLRRRERLLGAVRFNVENDAVSI